jgi:hypothetical protein
MVFVWFGFSAAFGIGPSGRVGAMDGMEWWRGDVSVSGLNHGLATSSYG